MITRFVDQTRFGPPDGNCGAACLATIFGVEIGDVPNMSEEGWEHVVSEWTKEFGYWVLNCSFPDGGHPPGIALAAVPSRIHPGYAHCVIFDDGMLVHDPNPQNREKEFLPYTAADVTEWTFFVALNPCQGAER